MASPPEEDYYCPICWNVFKNPVVVSCSHSFCKLCLMEWWMEKPTKECPVCNKRSVQDNPPENLVLKNLCEAFLLTKRQEACDETCRIHSERLRLYCKTDQEPVCVVCRDSKTHKDHSFSPVVEEAKDLREKLKNSLQPLEEKLKILEVFKETCVQTVEHIKLQRLRTEKEIQDQFKKLHQFLLEEEEARVKELGEEEEQKTQRMKVKMAAVSRDIEALSETIAATEEQLRATDVSFLLKHKAAAERVQRCPVVEEPQLGPGALIDQAKHLGNLAFNVWSNIKRLVQYRPVVLDPNTAHPELLLSNDLTSVSHRARENPPDNPERFDQFLSVLGSEAFDSGVHSWVVKVETSPDWQLGVASESFPRNGNKDSISGLWRIALCDGNYIALSMPNNVVKVSVTKRPKQIRVTLNFRKWKLFFHDAETNTYIYSFACQLTEKVFPYFSTNHISGLTIAPEEASENSNISGWRLMFKST